MLNLKFGNFRPIFLRSTIVIVAALFLNLWLPTNIFTFSTVKLKLGCNYQFIYSFKIVTFESWS